MERLSFYENGVINERFEFDFCGPEGKLRIRLIVHYGPEKLGTEFGGIMKDDSAISSFINGAMKVAGVVCDRQFCSGIENLRVAELHYGFPHIIAIGSEEGTLLETWNHDYKFIKAEDCDSDFESLVRAEYNC